MAKAKRAKPTKSGLKRLLDGLGETKSEVYKNLRKARVKGTPNYPESCPVARYLQKNGYEYCRVGTDHVYGNVVVKIPKPCKEFIEAFDGGEYKSLAEPKSA